METIATIGGTIINNVMTMLSNLQVPGLNISFLTFYFGLFIVSIAFVVLRFLFGIGVDDSLSERNYERMSEYRSHREQYPWMYKR